MVESHAAAPSSVAEQGIEVPGPQGAARDSGAGSVVTCHVRSGLHRVRCSGNRLCALQWQQGGDPWPHRADGQQQGPHVELARVAFLKVLSKQTPRHSPQTAPLISRKLASHVAQPNASHAAQLSPQAVQVVALPPGLKVLAGHASAQQPASEVGGRSSLVG